MFIHIDLLFLMIIIETFRKVIIQHLQDNIQKQKILVIILKIFILKKLYFKIIIQVNKKE